MESFNLNIIPGKDRPVCHASQYDIGRTIRVNLFEGFNVFTLDGTEVISISVRKPDGNVVTESVTNTSDSYVEFVTTEQMTACHGSNLCELKLEKGADVIGTMNFILEVEQDPLEGGVQSASEIDNLQTQVAGMVATEVANQYDSANVIFDPSPVPGHGNGYAVTSEGVATELALKQDATDANLQTTDTTVVGAINELNSGKQDATDANLQTTDQTVVGAINELYTGKADASDLAITDITSLIGTTPSGITLVDSECAVYKQGKHIFGTLLFKSTNDLIVNSDNLLLTMASVYKASKTQNFFGVTSNNQYNLANACYAYMSTSGDGNCELFIKAPTSGQKIAKVQIDYCIM